MKAFIFTFVVMTVIVLGLPVVELLVIKLGWGAFAGLVVLLFALLTTPFYVMSWLERLCAYDNRYSKYCILAIGVGMIRTIYMLWDVKPSDSGSLGIATAIILTVFTVLYCPGLLSPTFQTYPKRESAMRVMEEDVKKKLRECVPDDDSLKLKANLESRPTSDESAEERQWDGIYAFMFDTTPPNLREPICEEYIKKYSRYYTISPIEALMNMSEEVKTIKHDYAADLFASMGYMAAFVLLSRDSAIMSCRMYCKLRNIKSTADVDYRFIVEDASIRDALFDELGFLKPLDRNKNGQETQ